MNEQKEYVVFEYTTSDGSIMELAVVDEFEYERKEYVVASKIVDDTIDEEASFIFKVKPGIEFEVEKIGSEKEYAEISEAYMKL